MSQLYGLFFMLSYIYSYERQTHASLLINMGVEPLEIKNRLGHEKIYTTIDTYCHLYPDRQRSIADKLDFIRNRDDINGGMDV